MAKEFEVDVQRLGNDVEDARQNLQFLQSNLNKMFSDLQELDTMSVIFMSADRVLRSSLTLQTKPLRFRLRLTVNL